jgi:peptidoglycan/LPS O-acetylase OafA/YrhL
MQEQELIRSYTLTGLGRLGFCFFIGMFYAQIQHRFPLRFWHVALAGIVSAALLNTPLRLQAFSLALAALVLWLAFIRNPLLRAMSALPDYSYGIYIYAFVIQQILQFHFPAVSPLAKAALAFVLVLPAASLSWHVIEKPALSLKKKRKIAPGPDVAQASQARLG